MKQKFTTKIANYVKAGFLIIFLLAEFFGFGFIQTSQAASCTYTITDFTSSTTTATLTDSVSFTVKALRQSATNISECANSITFALMENHGNDFSATGLQSTAKFTGDNGSTATANFTYALSNLKNATPPPSQINFKINASTGFFGTDAASQTLTVYISGTTISTTISGASVRFDPPLAVYNAGDSIWVYLHVPAGAINGLDSNIQNIYFNLAVNGKNIGGFNKTRQDFLAGDQYSTLDITVANNFHNQTNAVAVSLWVSGTQSKIGEASANMQVQGLSTPTQAKVSADKTTGLKMGETINLTLKNPPSGNWDAEVYVNNSSQAIPMTNITFPLVLDAKFGFKEGDNTLEVRTFNSAHTQIALDTIPLKIGASGGGGPTGGGSTGSCTDPNKCLINPLPEEELTHVFLLVIQGFLGIVGIWAVIFIIIGGFQMVMASGNEEMYTKAKKTITWAVLGLIVALLSFSIIAIVQNLLKATVKPTSSTSYHQEVIKSA